MEKQSKLLEEQAKRFLARGWAYNKHIELIIDDYNKGFLKEEDAIEDIVEVLTKLDATKT
jgi:hypothetical protein